MFQDVGVKIQVQKYLNFDVKRLEACIFVMDHHKLNLLSGPSKNSNSSGVIFRGWLKIAEINFEIDSKTGEIYMHIWKFLVEKLKRFGGIKVRGLENSSSFRGNWIAWTVLKN